MTNLDSILKSWDITLPTKVHLVKAIFFPVVKYGYESWTIKKAGEVMLLNCGVGEDSWESLGLQRDWTSHPKGNQSWIFIGRTDAEAETPILWPPDAKNWFIGKDPDAGQDWRQKKGWQKMRWLDGSMDRKMSKLRELAMEREGWHVAVHGVTKNRTWLRDWTELNWTETRFLKVHVEVGSVNIF